VTELFHRIAIVTIENKTDDSRQFEGLRVTFDIDKNSGPDANTAKISVYNLNAKSRGFVENEGLRITLAAGYEGIRRDMPLIKRLFSGDVKKVKTEKSGPDFITTFEGGDSEDKIKNTIVNEAFQNGIKVRAVLNLLGRRLGVAKVSIEDVSDEDYISGIVLAGPVREYLDFVTRKEGLIWNIQDNKLIVKAPNRKKENEAIVVNSETGLVNTIIKTAEGVEFESLLNPLIAPNETIRLESKLPDSTFAPGFFVAQKCQYTGDTRGGNYRVKVEATS